MDGMSEQSDDGPRIYARPEPNESPEVFGQRFLAMIQDAAREAEQADEVDPNVADRDLHEGELRTSRKL